MKTFRQTQKKVKIRNRTRVNATRFKSTGSNNKKNRKMRNMKNKKIKKLKKKKDRKHFVPDGKGVENFVADAPRTTLKLNETFVSLRDPFPVLKKGNRIQGCRSRNQTKEFSGKDNLCLVACGSLCRCISVSPGKSQYII